MLKKVVLPAPFGPIRLTIERSGIVKSTSLTAIRPPNSLRTSSTTSRLPLGVVACSLIRALGPPGDPSLPCSSAPRIS